MHRQGFGFSEVDPLDPFALATGLSYAAQELRREGDRELLADLTILVRHDVARVRVCPAQSGYLDVVPRLLLDFADDRVGNGFTKS